MKLTLFLSRPFFSPKAPGKNIVMLANGTDAVILLFGIQERLPKYCVFDLGKASWYVT